MRFKRALAAAIATGSIATGLVAIAPAATAHTTGIHDNCTNLNKKWPHGVGRMKAVDKTTGIKVKNFFHSNKAYWAAENHNGTLDRDNDGIACEQR